MKIYVCCIPDRDFKLDFIVRDPIREYIDPRGRAFPTEVFGELSVLSDIIYMHNDDDIIGLEHYRRFFWDNDKQELLSQASIEKLLVDNDIIVTMDDLKASNILSHLYESSFNSEELRLANEIFIDYLIYLIKTQSDEFARTFMDYFIMNRQTVISRNMVIAKTKVIKDYVKWIQPKLFSFYNYIVDKKPDINYYRLFGYLAEYSFGYYISYNKLRFAYVNYMFIENSAKLTQ